MSVMGNIELGKQIRDFILCAQFQVQKNYL